MDGHHRHGKLGIKERDTRVTNRETVDAQAELAIDLLTEQGKMSSRLVIKTMLEYGGNGVRRVDVLHAPRYAREERGLIIRNSEGVYQLSP